MATTNRINEEHLTNLFILALWWQTQKSKQQHTRFTTVDAVCKVFVELGILSAKVKDGLRKDQILQRYFRRKVENLYGIDDVSVARNRSVCKRELFMMGELIECDIDQVRMLRDSRIYISVIGEGYAEKIAPKYASLLTETVYLTKRQEMRDRFEREVSNAGKVIVNEKYRERCEQDRD